MKKLFFVLLPFAYCTLHAQETDTLVAQTVDSVQVEKPDYGIKAEIWLIPKIL
jgi:hypothetical protein